MHSTPARADIQSSDRGSSQAFGGHAAAAVAVFAISLVVYLATLAPTVTGEDSGELVAAAWTLGIPHPPGYPAWCMLTWLFTWIPVGDAAFRCNLASAFFGALGSAGLVLVLGRLGARPVLAGATALLLAFATTAWSQAVITEVYALTLASLVGVVYAILRWEQEREDRWLFASALLCGVSLGVHNTILLLAPAILGYVLWVGRLDLLAPKRLGITLACLVAGLATHLYLPVRAAAKPAMNWGDPSTFERFWAHVTRAQYQPVLAEDRTLGGFLSQVKALVGFLVGQWPWPVSILVIVAAAWGLYAMARRNRAQAAWLGACGLLLSLGFVFLLNFRIEQEALHVASVFFIPAYAVLLLFAACGLESWTERLEAATLPALRSAVAVGACVAVIATVGAGWTSATMRGNDVARRFGEDLLATVPQDGILFTSADYEAFTVAYLKTVEKKRPDILTADEQRDVTSVVTAMGGVVDDDPVGSLAAQSKRPVYFTRRQPTRSGSFQPVGLLYRLVPPPKDKTPALIATEVEKRRQEATALDAQAWKAYRGAPPAGPWVRDWSTASMLSRYLEAKARSAFAQRDREKGREYIRQAGALLPGDPVHQNDLGALLFNHGELEDALAFYERAVALRPDYPEACYNQVTTLMELGRWDDAQAAYARSQRVGAAMGATGSKIESWLMEEKGARQEIGQLEQAVLYNPEDVRLWLALAQLKARFRRFAEAEEAYAKAVSVSPKTADAWQGLGQVRVRRRNDAGAIEAWNHYLELQPKGPAADEIRERVKQLQARGGARTPAS